MVNTNNGKIDIYESATVDGQQQQKKIDNRDNIAKKMLSTKFKDLMGDE